MSEGEAYEWQEIKLPDSIAVGAAGSGTLHYLEIEDKWTVYVHEPKMYEVDEGFEQFGVGGPAVPVGCDCMSIVRWSVAFESNEIAGGAIPTVATAKRIALTILEALEKGPPPEIPKESAPRPMGRRRGGH